MNSILETNFDFKGQVGTIYHGKVRDVYNILDRYLVMVVTDRISAFDNVLPQGIPHKGQVLNQISCALMDKTDDICPNWKIISPDPMVTIGYKADPFMVEMVIRGYLTGHAWREYKAGKRSICGVNMPDGMIENQKFETPIITPTTKAVKGHDEDISKEDIISHDLVSESDYAVLEDYTTKLFARGTEIADGMGLILVDTKYEFGLVDDKIVLIDEVHTPDSSRYFIKKGYEERQERGEKQRQLSKEFVREWLMDRGYQGEEGQKIPVMSEKFVNEVSERYIELYNKILNEKFEPHMMNETSAKERIFKNVSEFVNAL